MTSPSVLSSGLRGVCPNCGGASVFKGFLAMKPSCDACGITFPTSEAGDGPAFFAMFAALILIVPAAMFTELIASPPAWVHVVVWTPLTVAFCVAALRPLKATFLALQWRHNAGEARPGD